MLCPICEEQETASLCGPCGRSYDRYAHNDGTVLEAMIWAADRARRFARKRELRRMERKAWDALARLNRTLKKGEG